MCFGGDGKKVDPGATKNIEIEKQLKDDRKKQGKEVKILLLGAGESGKSTVLKQMRLINKGGFTEDERRQWRVVIFNNLVQAFNIVLRAMAEHDVRCELGNELYTAVIEKEPEIGPGEIYPSNMLRAFERLWDDRMVQQAILRGNEYALHDNLSYFFIDLPRLWTADYLPTDQDILHARLRTTVISETVFDVGSLIYRMFDVGGQRSERKKWIHVFDNVQAILFLVAISAYDSVLIEDRNGNQMEEALILFDNIVNSSWFSRTAIILFLNKIDLFHAKIRSGHSPISASFPDYKGPPDDVKAGQEYFAGRFTAPIRGGKKESAYIHYTNATDTDLLKKTMASVQDMIVQRNLNELML